MITREQIFKEFGNYIIDYKWVKVLAIADKYPVKVSTEAQAVQNRGASRSKIIRKHVYADVDYVVDASNIRKEVYELYHDAMAKFELKEVKACFNRRRVADKLFYGVMDEIFGDKNIKINSYLRMRTYREELQDLLGIDKSKNYICYENNIKTKGDLHGEELRRKRLAMSKDKEAQLNMKRILEKANNYYVDNMSVNLPSNFNLV